MSNNYDFIEIGTADFDTLIQTCSDNERGISIEALSYYQNKLPNRANVLKLNAAIVTEDFYKINPNIAVFYVPEEIIRVYGLGDWMKGCNSVGKPHDFHLRYFPDPSLWHNSTDEQRAAYHTRDLMKEGIVRTDWVPCMTYAMLMKQFNIGHIKLLKTDTEGQDAALLISIINYYKDNNLLDFLPEQIKFEDNVHSDREMMKVAKDLLRSVNYDIFDKHDLVHDSYATLNKV